MTIEAVVKFMEATSEKESLRKDFAGILGAGDGDVSNAEQLDENEAQALLGERGVLITVFAEQQGYEFTVAELNVVVGVFLRYQAGDLSEAEFSTALGLHTSVQPMQAVGNTVSLVYRGVAHHATVDSSPGHQVLEFMKKTAEDEQLRGELLEILSVGDGDISNFAELDSDEMRALMSDRGAMVAEFAARKGFLFTLADLFAVSDGFKRVQAGQLSEEEFAKFLKVNVGSSDVFPSIKKVVEMTYKGFNYTTAVATPTQDNALTVVRFMEESENDADLQAQLQEIIGGDGNISDPGELDAEEAQALLGDRSQKIVELGVEKGFRFTGSDLNAVVGAFQLVNAGQLSTENCARILGLGSAAETSTGGLGAVTKTAGLIYRGVRIQGECAP